MFKRNELMIQTHLLKVKCPLEIKKLYPLRLLWRVIGGQSRNTKSLGEVPRKHAIWATPLTYTTTGRDKSWLGTLRKLSLICLKRRTSCFVYKLCSSVQRYIDELKESRFTGSLFCECRNYIYFIILTPKRSIRKRWYLWKQQKRLQYL